MGFFSYDCKLCGHPLLSHYVLKDKNAWMNQGVAILEDGSVIKGEYDGYGRLNNHEISEYGSPAVYHKACYKLVGSPKEFDSPSCSSLDQGYFFSNDAHNCEEPKTLKEAEEIKKLAELHHQLKRNTNRISNLEYLIGSAAEKFEKIMSLELIPNMDRAEMKDFIKVMKDLVDSHKTTLENHEKERAKMRGINIELSKKIEEVVKKNMGEKNLSYYFFDKVDHVSGSIYKIYWGEDFYREIDIDTETLGEQKYIEEED
jgi:hypothetical protein